MTKLSRMLSKKEKARVKLLMKGLVEGRITNWTLRNSADEFNPQGAKRTSKKLAQTGLLLKHMDGAKRHYSG
jgi:hypothetical protein